MLFFPFPPYMDTSFSLFSISGLAQALSVILMNRENRVHL